MFFDFIYFIYKYTYMFMLMVGLYIFCSMYKHLLISLLGLEYLVLCIYMFMILFLMNYISDMYIILVFFTFSVCEGVLGLSILVNVIRCYGNDNINSLSMIKW